MSGGPTGLTGAHGLQGLRGLVGPPIGPTGPPVVSSTLTLNVNTPSSSTIPLTVYNLGTIFNITSNATTNGLITVTMPTTNLTYPQTIELFPAPEQAGMSWSFRNNTGSSIMVTFSNDTAAYGSPQNLSFAYLAQGNGFSLTYNGSNAFTIL
jgi:hypothetical protein